MARSSSSLTTASSSIALRLGFGIWRTGSLAPYLGNYTDASRQKARTTPLFVPKRNQRPVRPIPRREQIPPARRSGQESESRLQKRLVSAEREIGRLEGRLNELSDAVAIAGIDGDGERLERLAPSTRMREKQLDNAYAALEELNSRSNR